MEHSIITISREYGSGGGRIGELAAESWASPAMGGGSWTSWPMSGGWTGSISPSGKNTPQTRLSGASGNCPPRGGCPGENLPTISMRRR